MKDAYEYIYDGTPHGKYRKVELTGLCKEVSGGPDYKTKTYYQVKRKLFGFHVFNSWVPSWNIDFFDRVTEKVYNCYKCSQYQQEKPTLPNPSPE